ncbi:MAG: methyltransferase, partial [Anaerolineales bacterium]|nr:methyltransferase [Anaerolineales bacterium]
RFACLRQTGFPPRRKRRGFQPESLMKPEHLIQDGLFRRVCNPNYLGELLIYGSLALLSSHWAPFLVLAAYLTLYWIPNMLRKDRSLSRYPEFEAYKRRTKLFIPFLI